MDYAVRTEDIFQNLPDGKIIKLLTASQGKAKFYNALSQAKSPVIDLSDTELAITQVRDPQAYPVANGMRKQISAWTFYNEFITSEGAPIRQVQPAKAVTKILPGGDNLTSVLHFLSNRPEYWEIYEEIIEVLQIAFPSFEKLYFPSEAGEGKIDLVWKDRSFGKKGFSSAVLSDGILRFLCLVTVLLAPNQPSLICLDEPELGLHPALMKIIADLLKDASERTQIIIATHSPELINYFEPENVVIVESENGMSSLRRLDNRPELTRWLKDFTMGELWLTGELGGRP